MERIRSAHLKHHVALGTGWLEKSDSGANTVPLSYAAFELRLAAERLVLHYWALLNHPLEEADLRDLSSFKRMKNRIYELAGNQRLIDGRFDFMRTVLKALKIDCSLVTPDLSELSRLWHDCSELCHVEWNLASTNTDLGSEAFAKLTAAARVMSEHVAGLASFPTLNAPEFAALEKEYVEGRADRGDVTQFLQSRGAWAHVTYADGRPAEFIGEAIQPTSPRL